MRKSVAQKMQHEDYKENLQVAAQLTQRALDMLYEPKGIKRGLWYRLWLGLAQNILMTLFMREENRTKGIKRWLP